MLRFKTMQAVYDSCSYTQKPVGWRYVISLRELSYYILGGDRFYLHFRPHASGENVVDIYLCADERGECKVAHIHYYPGSNSFGQPKIIAADDLAEVLRSWGIEQPYKVALDVIDHLNTTCYY